jgi:cysteine desulfurase
VSAEAVAAALRPETALVTVMHANNEVGSVNPISEISAAVRAWCPVHSRPLIHTDAAQSVGKIPVDVSTLGVDLLTLVGLKLGAPKGVAALYVKQGLRLPNLLYGGGQEAGRRAGTESVLLLVALGKACQIAAAELPAISRHMEATRGRLAQLLVEGLGEYGPPDPSPAASADTSLDASHDTCQDVSKNTFRTALQGEPADTSMDAARDGPSGVRIHGPADMSHRLPNTLSIGLRGVQAAELLAALSDRLAASAGAACHTGAAGISPVLRAMGVPIEYAVGTLRLSTGRHTTMAEVEAAAQLIIGEARRQRAAGQLHECK